MLPPSDTLLGAEYTSSTYVPPPHYTVVNVCTVSVYFPTDVLFCLLCSDCDFVLNGHPVTRKVIRGEPTSEIDHTICV